MSRHLAKQELTPVSLWRAWEVRGLRGMTVSREEAQLHRWLRNEFSCEPHDSVEFPPGKKGEGMHKGRIHLSSQLLSN